MERSEAKEIINDLNLYDIQIHSWEEIREAIEVAVDALSDKGYEIGYRDGWQKCANYSVSFWKKAIEEEFEKGISDGNR